jgi:hypothetical protein
MEHMRPSVVPETRRNAPAPRAGVLPRAADHWPPHGRPVREHLDSSVVQLGSGPPVAGPWRTKQGASTAAVVGRLPLGLAKEERSG